MAFELVLAGQLVDLILVGQTGHKLHGLASELRAIIAGLEPEDTAVLYADDPVVAGLAGGTKAKVLTFGEAAPADVRIEGLSPQAAASRQLALDDRPQGWREAEVAADAALGVRVERH